MGEGDVYWGSRVIRMVSSVKSHENKKPLEWNVLDAVNKNQEDSGLCGVAGVFSGFREDVVGIFGHIHLLFLLGAHSVRTGPWNSS